MWLLSTNRAELHYFSRNSDADGGYAILSHTWDKHEQSFQDVQAIGEDSFEAGTNPRDHRDLSPKVREFLILAEKNGYRWAWADSCCIDKTSSSELSEAINSMYQWYAEAEVCYAYLADVPGDDDVEAPDSAFQESRWHTRGWTLQELIAPESVIFLSSNWGRLGNRAALANLIQKITGVPAGILTGEDRPAEFSVSMRMTWASKRQTTRVEDQAYCLMGLFGVSMSTNYGEGKKAFIRLQYEIMQHNPDMSLFAFGRFLDQEDIRDHRITLRSQGHIDRGNSWQYLMAESPQDIINKFYFIPDLGSNAKQIYPPAEYLSTVSESSPSDEPTTTHTGPFDSVEMPRISVTSYGVKLRLPVATIDKATIAVMLVCAGDGRNFGLFLTKDPRAKDPRRPRFFIGCDFTQAATGDAPFLARMADLGHNLYNLTFNGQRIEPKWSTIYVLPSASHVDAGSATIPSLMLNSNPASRFRFPRWLVSRLISLQFEVDQVRNTDMLQVIRIVHRVEGRIWISLGSCTSHHDHDHPCPLWAKVDIVSYTDPTSFPHNCTEDHIDSKSWAGRSKEFGDTGRRVRLSLMPSTQMSDSRLLLSLELFGSVFEKLLVKFAISFPSLSDFKGSTAPPPTRPARRLRAASDAQNATTSRSGDALITQTSRTPLTSIHKPSPNSTTTFRGLKSWILSMPLKRNGYTNGRWQRSSTRGCPISEKPDTGGEQSTEGPLDNVQGR